MIEHEAEGSVTAPHRRGEGIVQVRFIPPQHDVALQLRDMRTLRRRPAGVDGAARRIQRRARSPETADAYLLRGRLACGDCGNVLRTDAASHIRYYLFAYLYVIFAVNAIYLFP